MSDDGPVATWQIHCRRCGRPLLLTLLGLLCRCPCGASYRAAVQVYTTQEGSLDSH